MDNKEHMDGEITQEKFKGIKGLLIILGIGVIFTPFIHILGFGYNYIDFINSGGFAALTSIESNHYIQGYFWFLCLEIILSIGFIFYASLLVYLFFHKSKYFPKLFLIFVISVFIFRLLNYLSIYVISDMENFIETEQALKGIYRSLFDILTWGLYVIFSKRVKYTFVEEIGTQKSKFLKVVIFFIALSFGGVLSKIEYSKLIFNEEVYGKSMCQETFGEYSYFVGTDPETSEYVCDCQKGYEFGGDDGNTCILIQK